MDSILNFFNQGWVGSFIGIVGVIFGIVTFRISKIKARLVYQWESLKVIGKDSITPDGIEIAYKGKKVSQVIMTRIVIWNSGKETLNGSKIVNDDPLIFQLNEGEEIISLDVLKESRKTNKTMIISSDSNRTATLKFDYLEPNDGVIIEILHTDLIWKPKLKGSIQGIPEGPLNWNNHIKKITDKNDERINDYSQIRNINPQPSKPMLYTSMVISILVGIGAAFSNNINEFITYTQNNNIVRITFAALAGLYLIISVRTLYGMRKNPPKELNMNIIYNNKDHKK